MSATDSDNSIDWLASDNESEQETDRRGRQQSQAEAPPSPSGSPHLGTSDGGEAEEGKGHRSEAAGPRNAQQAEKTGGKTPQQAPKRARGGSTAEDVSERTQLFRKKCTELQCYVHPLSSILNGLRSGRYRERLSTFQESVAMDRIQRIMGVLQNPCTGERYINIILKMEEMLKTWFPNVQLRDQLTVTQTEEALPAKKLKLSPATAPEAVSAVGVGGPPAGVEALGVTAPPGAYSASTPKWLHTSPVCSPAAQQGPPPPGDLTQDSAVSSSTDGHGKTHSAPRRPPPPPGKINAPCLERLLMSTESIIIRKGTAGLTDSSWS